jgi:hypothetical protein
LALSKDFKAWNLSAAKRIASAKLGAAQTDETAQGTDNRTAAECTRRIFSQAPPPESHSSALMEFKGPPFTDNLFGIMRALRLQWRANNRAECAWIPPDP